MEQKGKKRVGKKKHRYSEGREKEQEEKGRGERVGTGKRQEKHRLTDN